MLCFCTEVFYINKFSLGVIYVCRIIVRERGNLNVILCQNTIRNEVIAITLLFIFLRIIHFGVSYFFCFYVISNLKRKLIKSWICISIFYIRKEFNMYFCVLDIGIKKSWF